MVAEELSGAFGIQLPMEVWKQVAALIPPNALLYVRLALVSRMFCKIFLADQLWAKLTPVAQDKCFARAYSQRIPKHEFTALLSTWSGLTMVAPDASIDLVFACALMDTHPPRQIVDSKYWSKRGFVEKIVAIDGYKIVYASYELRTDAEICRLALESIPRGRPQKYGMPHPFEFTETPDNVLLAIEKWGTSYVSNAPEHIRTNPEYMLKAAALEPLNVLYVHPILKLSESFMRAAVQLHGQSIEFASYNIKGNREIAELAVTDSGHAFEFLNEPLRNNYELAKLALEKWPGAYRHLSPSLQQDEQLRRLALVDPMQLQFMGSNDQDDFELVISVVKRKGWALEFASDRLRNDRQVVEAAVLRDAGAFQFASTALRSDFSLAGLAAGRGAHWVMDYAITEDPWLI